MFHRTLVALSLVVTIGLSGCGGSSSPVTPTSSTPPTPTRVIRLGGNLGFGNVQVGEVRTDGLLTISNDGNATLTVTSITLPCGSSYVASWTSGTIPAGSTQAVSLRFAPTTAQNCTGLLTVIGDQTAGTNTISVTAVAVAAPPPAVFSKNLTGTWRGTLTVDTVVYLTHNGTNLSGEYNAVNMKGSLSGTVSSTGHVTFTVTVSGYQPFTFDGNSDSAGNTITGVVNGSGFSNDTWTLKRQ
jgi:hypothetical protein